MTVAELKETKDPTIQRFLSRITESQSGCWLWTGGLVSKRAGQNYGQFHASGRPVRAHRWIYGVLHGKPDPSLKVCHHCDNPQCVNPQHLFLGTATDNLIDAHRKGRLTQIPKMTERSVELTKRWIFCRKGHQYEPQQPGKKSYCKACSRERWERRKRKKAVGDE